MLTYREIIKNYLYLCTQKYYCNMKTISDNRTFWLLLIICCLTLLPFLGLPEYHTKGEPRESIVSYSMIETGNWVLPRNNGGEMAYKPPFFHWCVAAVSVVWGKVTEATSRVPSAIALILMTLSTFCFYHRRNGVRVALVTALVAYTCFELHRAGANCRVDMVLTALTVGSLYLLYKWYENGLRGVPLLAILLMGLGTMTKGPVGSLIPCLVMGCFMILRGVNFFKTFLLLFAWGLLSLIPYAVWFFFAWQQGGQEFLDLMYEENIGRMTSTMGYESCVEPWYYNFITVIAGYVPWTLMLVISLFFLKYRKPSQPATWWHRFSQWIRQMNAVDLFSLTAIVVIFVFYCIPQSKRSVYLMPIYPFIAYFISRLIRWMERRKLPVVKIYGSILAVLSILLLVCFVVVKSGMVPENIFGTGRHAAQNVMMLHALEDINGLGSWLLVLVPPVLGIAWFGLPRKNIFGVLVLTLGLYFSLDGVYTPTVLNAKSLKHEASQIDKLATGALYEYIEAGVKAKGDPVHFFELNFYLGNRIGSFHQEQPSEGFLLISKDDAENNFPEFQRKGYAFKQVYETDRRQVQLYQFTLRAGGEQ